MAEERIEVQLASPERHYVKVYNDFLNSEQLTTEEKMVYIALKSFVSYGQDEGQVFPSMETLCKITSMSRPRATRAITGLIRKGIVKKKRRGLTKSNIYTLYDNAAMWAAESEQEMRDLAERNITLSSQEMLEELKRRGVIEIVNTKKEPASGTDQSTEASTSFDSLDIVLTTNNSTQNFEGSQERYSLENVRELFDYAVLASDKRCSISDLDSVMNILYDVLNTTKTTIRVSGENKPAMVVIGKLMKLTYEEILYSIQKFNERTDRIGNPRAYMLTILYTAREQMNLDINNQVQHDLYGENI